MEFWVDSSPPSLISLISVRLAQRPIFRFLPPKLPTRSRTIHVDSGAVARTPPAAPPPPSSTLSASPPPARTLWQTARHLPSHPLFHLSRSYRQPHVLLTLRHKSKRPTMIRSKWTLALRNLPLIFRPPTVSLVRWSKATCTNFLQFTLIVIESARNWLSPCAAPLLHTCRWAALSCFPLLIFNHEGYMLFPR